MDESKVHHVISSNLKHGRYYRVYVTQVSKYGVESEKSAPALIRVGDVTAPPVPILSLDNSFYSNGCHANDSGLIDVYMKWTESVCDDLDHYVGYMWMNFDGYTKDGIYQKDKIPPTDIQGIFPSGCTSTIVNNQRSGDYVYFGIQAVDISHNASDIYVIRVRVQDEGVVGKPTEPIHAEPYATWAIRVWTKCPYLTYIKSILIFRDGDTENPIASLLFHAGLEVEFIDHLDCMLGLTHFYRYCYVTYDGRRSPLSDPSETVSAEPIDFSYVNQVELEKLKEMWKTDNINDINAIREQAENAMNEAKKLSTELSKVKLDYDEMYNNFRLAANEIELLSAKIEEQDDKLQVMSTQIEQNGKEIALRATKSYVDKTTGDLSNQFRAQLSIEGDKINSIVSDLSLTNSQITQLSDMIDMKVSKGDVNARITAAIQNGISTACITADRIVLLGQMLLQGNARICGRLYSNEMALVDSNTGQVVWGSGSGEVKPAVLDIPIIGNGFKQACRIALAYENGGVSGSLYSFRYTPRPPVTFNGVARVKITFTFDVGVGADKNLLLSSGAGLIRYDETVYYDDRFLAFGVSTSKETNYSNAPEHVPLILTQPTKGWESFGVPNGGSHLNQDITVDGFRGKEWHYWTNQSVSYSANLAIGEPIDVYIQFSNTCGTERKSRRYKDTTEYYDVSNNVIVWSRGNLVTGQRFNGTENPHNGETVLFFQNVKVHCECT